MAQQHLFETPTSARLRRTSRVGRVSRRESQHFRTQSADRPRRNFEDENPARTDPALRVHGPVAETQRIDCTLDLIDDRPLNLLLEFRGRDVNRLLKEWPIERIGFIENRERL